MNIERAWQQNRMSWDIEDMPQTEAAFCIGVHYGLRVKEFEEVDVDKAVNELQDIARSVLKDKE